MRYATVRMAAPCYTDPADCDVATIFELLNSNELPAGLSSWLQPQTAAVLQPEGSCATSQQQEKQKRQQGQGQSGAVPVVAKRSARRSTNKDKQVSGYQGKRQAINRMEKELTNKLLLAKRLEADHARLQAEHQLLSMCCEGLQLLRLQHIEMDGSCSASNEELALLQQLQDIPCSPASGVLTRANSTGTTSTTSSGSGNSSGNDACGAAYGALQATGGSLGAAAAAAAASDFTQVQFSPPDDIMYYYRQLMSLPPCPGADTVTVEELVGSYASLVRELALQLHLLHQPAGCCPTPQEQPLQKIRALLDGHIRMLSTLVLLQRTEIMQRFASSNFETGKLTDPDHKKHCWVLQQLHLSEQQVSSITQAMNCFKRLLDPIVQERQQLQHKLAQQQEQPGGGSSSSSSVDVYKQCMAKRGAMLSRLSKLMQKEYMLRLAAAAAIAGALTYVQLATAAVQMTPHVLSLQMLGMLVLEQQKQQGQEQEQRAQQN